jgi:hypothetical protein
LASLLTQLQWGNTSSRLAAFCLVDMKLSALEQMTVGFVSANELISARIGVFLRILSQQYSPSLALMLRLPSLP